MGKIFATHIIKMQRANLIIYTELQIKMEITNSEWAEEHLKQRKIQYGSSILKCSSSPK